MSERGGGATQTETVWAERERGLYTAAEGAQRHRGECCGAAIRQERSSSPTHQPAACSQVSKTRQSADLSPS